MSSTGWPAEPKPPIITVAPSAMSGDRLRGGRRTNATIASARHVLEDDGQALADADADRGDAPALARTPSRLRASVPRMRVPDAPSGWPIAIAPPWALTIAGSMSQALTQASDCAANASLSSTAPTSSQPMPARFSARLAASTGAKPKNCGSLAAAPRPAIRASGSRPSMLAAARAAEQRSRRAVVERRGVAGRHRAVGAEHRLEARPASPAVVSARIDSSRARSTPGTATTWSS